MHGAEYHQGLRISGLSEPYPESLTSKVPHFFKEIQYTISIEFTNY